MDPRPTSNIMTWRRRVPHRPGYWLRLNAGGRVEISLVLRLDARLHIPWGWGGESGLIPIQHHKHKLGGFLWYGPIPRPPQPTTRWRNLPESKMRKKFAGG